MPAHPVTVYREKHGLSKAELARRAKMPWRRLHRVETGEQVPTAKTAKKLHEATNGELNAADLLSIPAAPSANSTDPDPSLPLRVALLTPTIADEAADARTLDDEHLESLEREAAARIAANATDARRGAA